MNHLRCLAILFTFSLVGCGAVVPTNPDAGPTGDDVDSPDAPPPLECTSAAECTAGAPVCDDSEHTCGACSMAADCAAYADTPACGPDGACVECATSSDCRGTTPVCEDLTCRGCELDTECASGACDFDTGRCYQPAEIVHVTPGGAAAAPCGTASNPCGSLTVAATLVSATRPIIRMHEGTYGGQNITAAAARFTVHGAGAEISVTGLPYTAGLFTGNGIDGTFLGMSITIAAPVSPESYRAVDVNVGTRIELRDVVIRTTGAMTTGIETEGDFTGERLDIRTSGYAIASYAGSVTLAHSVIDQSYGIHLGAPTFAITNNLFIRNRATAITVDSPTGTPKQVAYNTFVGNGSLLLNGATEINVVRAVFPNPLTRFGSTANLFTNSRPYTWNGTSGLRLQAGAAPYRSLLDQPGHPVALDGNSYAPALISPDGHLTAGSPAIDGVNTTSVVADDRDGDARPVGPNPDIGADEYAP